MTPEQARAAVAALWAKQRLTTALGNRIDARILMRARWQILRAWGWR